MKERTAESRDIDTIWPKLADRMLSEYRHAGFSNVAVVKGIFRKVIKAGDGVAYTTDDGALLAVMMWQPEGAMISTGFAASDDFFVPKNVLPFSRLLRKFQLDRGNPRLISHSHSEHPSVTRWFNTLGFVLVREEGVHRDFVKDRLKSL